MGAEQQSKPGHPAPISLPVIDGGPPKPKPSRYARWRAASLIAIHLLAGLHIAHWVIAGSTVAPLELNELMYTLELGIVTAGFLLMVTAMVATALFGRFFCSWMCHILALQDLCAWLLGKVGIRPRPVRSRVLLLIGPGAMLYMFVWPQISRIISGGSIPTLRLLDDSGGWASFITDDFWRNLPGPIVAGLTFFICGFVIVYFLGSRSFCQYACPYGAVFAIADRIAPGRLVEIDNRCDQCGLCTGVCESHVRVHEEIGKFGMIVDANCLKDLDCVSVCPKDAIGFRITRPSLARSFSDVGRRRLKYDFTLLEDAVMIVVFLATLAITRGLYGYGPFLMALAVGGIVAYLSVLTLRLLRRANVRLNNFQLKRAGALTKHGRMYLGLAAVLFVFLAHSGFIRYHEISGESDYERMRVFLHEKQQNPPASLIESAKGHAHSVERWGLIRPRILDGRLASLHSFDEPPTLAAEYFDRAIEQNPSDRALRIQYSQTLLRLERFDAAQEQLLAAAMTEPKSAHERAESENQRATAANMLGRLRGNLGDIQGAADAFALALTINPDDAQAHHGMAQAMELLGRDDAAMHHRRELNRLTGDR